MTYTSSDGYANSQLVGALVNVDVMVNGSYLTSLSKNYYGRECAFDMSPVLTTVAKYGQTVPYNYEISYTKNGEYSYVGAVSNNHVTPGYMCNQGAKYLNLATSTVIVAQNFYRGDSRNVANKTILYLYGDTIPVSY
jgi:hypothetical protein